MKQKTEIETCWAADELRAAVFHALPNLTWRRHGIGALQAYLSEREPEVRVHIWHPGLLVPGMEFPRNVHTHRFLLQSTVLVGELDHIEYDRVDELTGGQWVQPHEVTHARAQGKNELPVAVGPPLKILGTRYTIFSGQTYWYPKDAYHATEANGFAVTIICKRGQEDFKARVMAPVGIQPSHGFTAPMTETEMDPFIRRAYEELR